jgi:hypothetical protein
MSNILNAKVKAVNKANEQAHKLYKELIPIFEQFVGQTILKADGKLLKRIETLVPKYPYNEGMRITTNISSYTLAWTASACEHIQGDSSCLYHEVTAYIGHLENGVLKSLHAPADRRTDFTAAEIEEKRRKYEEAKKIADDILSSLHPFGQYDR